MESEDEGRFSRCNTKDMARIMAMVREAAAANDYALVFFHSHEFKGLGATSRTILSRNSPVSA